MTEREREQNPDPVADPAARPVSAPGGASCAALEELDLVLGEFLAGLEALRAALATAPASRKRGTSRS